jgi:two-component sensor histidine kinase
MQWRQSESADVREALQAVLTRLTALSALHEAMHEVGEAGRVDVAQLIARTIDKIKMLVGDHIRFELRCEEIDIPAGHASAVALTVNEFVANAVKHGFDEGRGGTVSIAVEGRADGYHLLCRDDGRGDAAAIARIVDSEGLGTRVIGALASSIGANAEWTAAEPGVRLVVEARL